ncbi:MAG: hypothetical protein R3F31_08160 [Verrucomicrobiales bacterium]
MDFTPEAANTSRSTIRNHQPRRAKLAEALHYLKLHRSSLPTGSHWLELGACPGGMTSELLARDYHVTAIDRAPLDPRVAQQNGLVFVNADVSTFVPLGSVTYEAMLCDMNGPPGRFHRSGDSPLALAETARFGGVHLEIAPDRDAGGAL